MLGESPSMLRLREDIAKVAPTSGRVLITGESGTGKELIAAGDPPPVEARGGSLRQGELRRHPLRAHRVRAVRPREGELHRRGRPAAGAVRGGRRRNALPRRDWRHEPLRPGQGAPRPPDRRGHARRAASGILTVDVRVVAATNKDLRGRGAGGDLPRGPVLPAQRGPHPLARPARAARRRAAAGGALLPPGGARERDAPQAGRTRGLRPAEGGTAGPATCASSATSASGW